MEIYEKLCNELNESGKVPSDFRRNVLTRGADLNQWIGKQFSLQGIKFEGVELHRHVY